MPLAGNYLLSFSYYSHMLCIMAEVVSLCFEQVACLLWTVTIFTYFNIKPANRYINTVSNLQLGDLIYPKKITVQISDPYPVHIIDYSLHFTQKCK